LIFIFKFPECFKQNHPRTKQNLLLYRFEITENDSSSASSPLLDKTVHIGYLTSKLIENTSEFILYQTNKEFLVNTMIALENFQLEETDLNLLQNLNETIYVDILKMLNIEFDYHDSSHGGLFVLLKKSLLFYNTFYIY